VDEDLAKVPYGHWKTMTFIDALRCDRIDAQYAFDYPSLDEIQEHGCRSSARLLQHSD
jgi:hypothetical protein